jgi:cyanophycinase
MYGPLLRAAGPTPTIACIVLDEGDGFEQFQRWAEALLLVGACTPTPVIVAQGEYLDIACLDGADGVLVCGGLTPAYAHSVSPAGGALRQWLSQDGRPYAGFSAGAAIAADAALVGGWRYERVPVCPEDAGEDLDEISVVPGIGLIPFTIDVHAAQWGTLTRLIDVVRRRLSRSGLAIDENTVVTVRGDRATVSGAGRVHLVTSSSTGANVRTLASGEGFPIT